MGSWGDGTPSHGQTWGKKNRPVVVLEDESLCPEEAAECQGPRPDGGPSCGFPTLLISPNS